MTVTTDAVTGRFGIFTRTRGRPWQLVVHVGDKAAAERLMVQLASEARGSADWCVRPVSDPPTPIAAAGRSSRAGRAEVTG
jgi:hypothetical protein